MENNGKNNHSRRDILKRAAATGAISSVALTGIAGAQRGSSNKQSSQNSPVHDGIVTGSNGRVLGYEDSEVKVNEPEPTTGGRARREARGALSNKDVGVVRDYLQQQGLRPDIPGASAIDVSFSDNVEDPAYDQEQINGSDPVAVTIPFVPTGTDETKGGLLKVFMLDDGSRRVAGGAAGFYAEDHGDSRELRVIGQSDGEASIVHEETLAGGFSSSGYVECMTCELVAGAICEGTYGTVGLSGCMFICAGAGPAWLACTPVCVVIVGVSVSVMCYVGVDAFCKQEGFC